MYIQTEETPNPNTLKFVPGVEVYKHGTLIFNKNDDYSTSALVTKLFNITGVASLFFGSDFISVTKEDQQKWSEIKTHILADLVDHFISGIPIVEDKKQNTQELDEKTLSKIEKEILSLIDTKIRPAVAQDGGDIVFRKFENGVVYLEMQGACSGCPSSAVTLKQGVENMLKHYIPEVESVESI